MSIKIHVTGGAVSIGALNQGNAATVTGSATLSQAAVDLEFERAAAALGSLAQVQGRSAEELRTVLAQMEKLKLAVLAPQPDSTKGSTVLKVVRENFGWAYPVLKDLAAVAWPALLTLIAN